VTCPYVTCWTGLAYNISYTFIFVTISLKQEIYFIAPKISGGREPSITHSVLGRTVRSLNAHKKVKWNDSKK
jgi:hypothetical protein